MKTLFKPLLVLVLATVTLASCMKDTSAEDEARQREIEEKIFAQLEADTKAIQDFADENPSEAPGGWRKDDVDQRFPTLNKTVKRGYQFEVLADPIPEEGEEEYEYKFAQNGQGVIFPKVKVNYSVSLLNGTEVQSGENREIDLATFHTNQEVYTDTWVYSFFPKTIRYNEEDRHIGGLTAKGLRKGSHIRVLAPSLYAFGDQKVGEIPANSPLVYEFEVLEIE